MKTPVLYHFTCEHTRQLLGEHGVLLPASQLGIPLALVATADLIWATDQEAPDAQALGLTRTLVKCDRTAHRYRILQPHNFQRWGRLRASYPQELVDALELSPGAAPAHWWVSRVPIAAALDQP